MKKFAERPLLLLLAAIQFTHITDFMMVMPLGPQLMRELSISPGQFASLVSAYTVTSGLVTLCMAPFIDRFDRRTLLLWMYAGFAGGTLACGLSHSFPALFVARATCGAFGGISASLVMATVSDIVPPERRAAGMGIVKHDRPWQGDLLAGVDVDQHPLGRRHARQHQQNRPSCQENAP